jgi:hypothetical protein
VVPLLEGAMMLRRYFIKAALLLLLVSSASVTLADNESPAQLVRQTVESYCKIEFDGGWIEDRWAVIKFGSKRKVEEKIKINTDAHVFEIEYYPFIIITSYDIREVNLLNPTHATAKVAYNRVARAVRNKGKDWRDWHLVADRQDGDLVTLNLVFEKNKWLVLDPPPPRVSRDVLILDYESELKWYEDRQKEIGKLPDHQQEAYDRKIGTLKILKGLP